MGGHEPARTLVLEGHQTRQARGHGKQSAAGFARQRDLCCCARAWRDVAFEAAVGRRHPIIKALREGLTANRIE